MQEYPTHPKSDGSSSCHEPLPVCAVVMASGRSVRFGSDKLSVLVDGIPMAERLFQALPPQGFRMVAVVSGNRALLETAQAYGFTPVFNDDEDDDPAKTVRLGLDAVGDCAGCAFFVADQPWLRRETIAGLLTAFRAAPERVHLPAHQGVWGNPVFFPQALFQELRALPAMSGGKAVVRRHPDLVTEWETDPHELKDVDYPSDLL